MLTYKADVLIPVAMEGAITENNAAQVQAEVVVEAANAPVTPEAHDSMTGRVMRRAYADVAKLSAETSLDLRTSASRGSSSTRIGTGLSTDRTTKSNELLLFPAS